MASPYPRIPGSVVKQTQACPPFLCCQWWNSSGELEQGSRLSDSICIKVEFWPVWTSGQIRKTLWNVGKHVCFSLSGSEKISYLIQREGRRKPEILNLERQRGVWSDGGGGRSMRLLGAKLVWTRKEQAQWLRMSKMSGILIFKTQTFLTFFGKLVQIY